MGYAVQGVCYASFVEARDAYMTSVTPLISGSTVMVPILQNDGYWVFNQYQVQASAAMTYQTKSTVPFITLPACTDPTSPTESFTDGMLLGWGVAAAMVLAWAVMHLRKGL